MTDIARYGVTAWHGEGKSVFYVVDRFAPDDAQPAVITNYRDKESADNHAKLLNRGRTDVVYVLGSFVFLEPGGKR